MAPMPAAICGTCAPTAKNRVATAMPNWPVALSRAMIDQVICALWFEHDLFGKPASTFPDHASSPGRVALHAARIGGGATAAAEFRGGGEAALRPVGAGLHDMAALL